MRAFLQQSIALEFDCQLSHNPGHGSAVSLHKKNGRAIEFDRQLSDHPGHGTAVSLQMGFCKCLKTRIK